MLTYENPRNHDDDDLVFLHSNYLQSKNSHSTIKNQKLKIKRCSNNSNRKTTSTSTTTTTTTTNSHIERKTFSDRLHREELDNDHLLLYMKNRSLDLLMKQIDVDVPRTFGGSKALQGVATSTDNNNENAEVVQRKKLGRVLKCYARRNPSLGYCQSMNLIIGLFLSLGFSEENCFWLLTELAERIVCLQDEERSVSFFLPSSELFF
jgi:hypothetical protein